MNPGANASSEVACRECGTRKTPEDCFYFDAVWICAECKPGFLQRLREGLPTHNQLPLSERVPAGRCRRTAAFLLDWILIHAILLALFTLVAVPIALLERYVLLESITPIAQTLELPLFILYFTLFHGRLGATPGARLLRFRVVRVDGQPVGYRLALKRVLLFLPGFVCMGLILIRMLIHPDGLGYHDQLSRTRPIRV